MGNTSALKSAAIDAYEIAETILKKKDYAENDDWALVTFGYSLDVFAKEQIVFEIVIQKYFRGGVKGKDRERFMHIQDVCPKCGDASWSLPINDLEQLGKMLSAFKPYFTHKCDGPDSEDIQLVDFGV